MSAAVLPLVCIIIFACLSAHAADSAPVTARVAPRSEAIVMLTLDGDPLVESFLVHEEKGRLLVPVCALADALSLAITCGDRRAFGFVLRESQPFVVDVEERFAIYGRSAFKINDEAYAGDEDIFVDIRELSRWLPIDFSFHAGTSTVDMHAREILPVQGLKKRQRFRQVPRPLVQKPYDDVIPARGLVTIPTIDVTTQVRLSGEDHSAMSSTVRNSLDLCGDLLYMSNETHLLVEDDALKRLDTTFFSNNGAERRLGPLPVTQLGIGASQAPYIDGIGAATTPMYGFFLSNRPLDGSAQFLTHDLHGYLPPGWDAKVFHNGVQIGYQPPSGEGMYHFVNLQVYYGINNFKVILHGPFGERRESEEIFVSDATTPRGELLYTLSAGWQTGLNYSEKDNSSDAENQTLTSDFGILKNLTGAALLVRHRDENGEQEYVGAGMRTALRNTLLSLDLIQSYAPASGTSGQLLTFKSSSRNVFGFNLEVVQRLFRDYQSPQFPETADPLWSRSTVKGNTSFPLWAQIRIPFSAEIILDAKRSGTADVGSRWQVSGGWNGWNAALETDLSYLQGAMRASTILQLSTRLQDMSIRGQAGISLEPDLTPSTIDLNADKEFGHGFQLNTGIFHDPVGNVSGVRVGVSKRFGAIGYSISANGSSEGAYSVNAAIRASVALDNNARQAVVSAEPLSPYGMIAASAVASAAHGTQEEPVAGVGFLVNGGRARIINGSKGGAVIAYLQPDVPVEVTVDLSTVDDPFMVPLQEGCRIIPRSGVVSYCRFTMTTGGEIDGMVLAVLNSSGEVPLKGVRVDLLTEGAGGQKLQASTRSEDSGYYLFKTVRPGQYLVAIPEQEHHRLHAAKVPPLQVTIPEGGDMISGQDFLLRSAVPERVPEAAAGRVD